MTAKLSTAQQRMLQAAHTWDGAELAELYREACDDDRLNSGLSWRNADRTADALMRRGLIVLEGEQVRITEAGELALKGGR